MKEVAFGFLLGWTIGPILNLVIFAIIEVGKNTWTRYKDGKS